MVPPGLGRSPPRSIRICTGYEVNGVGRATPPTGAEGFAECRPVYEEHPGWQASTVGVKTMGDLPANARAYLKRLEQVTGTPIDMVSTGPERTETIILKHPFD